MKVRICFCAESLVWIAKHLQKSAIKRWKMMVADAPFQDPEGGMKPFKTFTAKQINRASRPKRRRTPKQIRATKKLIAFNKRRRLRR